MSREKKAFTMRLDAPLLEAFHETARSLDRPSAQVVREFMRDFVEKHQPKETKKE